MANPWLRLYAEIRRDPKVRTMPETFQLRLIWLLTLRCEGLTEKMSNEELMYGLDCDEPTLLKIHQTFMDKGFIEQDWSVTNWDKRQYISDSSTPRVQKYRALKRGETFQKQFHETHETQNETDQNRPEQNRTDTEQKKPTARATRLPKEFTPSESHEQIALERHLSLDGELAAFRDFFNSAPGQKGLKLDWDATFRNWLRNSRNGGSNGKGQNHFSAEGDRSIPRVKTGSAYFDRLLEPLEPTR